MDFPARRRPSMIVQTVRDWTCALLGRPAGAHFGACAACGGAGRADVLQLTAAEPIHARPAPLQKAFACWPRPSARDADGLGFSPRAKVRSRLPAPMFSFVGLGVEADFKLM
ncbi:MAG TPA: hypothetical protein VL728_08835 [Cyclobacteriaceae bacterium]|nr:hypothetical protein [Cyclobacteriaceae bacterium]